jgi:hypothetical protein
MNCPHWPSRQTRNLAKTTDLGYVVYRCQDCRRCFNERTGTPFNFLEMPTNIVFQVVLFRLLFKLSLRDLVQMFLIRGYELSHETVRDWEARFASLFADQVRRRRKNKGGRPLEEVERCARALIALTPTTTATKSQIPQICIGRGFSGPRRPAIGTVHPFDSPYQAGESVLTDPSIPQFDNARLRDKVQLSAVINSSQFG